MVTIGIILIIIGIFTFPILLYVGIALLIAGLVLNFVPIGGTTRRWY